MANAATRAVWQTFGRAGYFVYQSPKGGLYKILNAFTAELVAGAATVDMLAPAESPATAPLGIQALDYVNFGLWVQCAGGGPSITMKLVLSWDDVAADYAVPETGGSLITIADTLVHVVAVTPVLMPWLRLRAVGGVANSPDTTVTANLILAAEA